MICFGEKTTKYKMETKEPDPYVLRKHLGFLPLTSAGCTGPPHTPYAEDSDPNVWCDGSILQPEEITRTLFSHQLKSVGDMERFEKKEPIILPPWFRTPTLCNRRLNGQNVSIMHVTYSKSSNRKLFRHFGIQSDLVGYGKTLSMVSLIARDKMEWDTSTQFCVSTNMYQGMFSMHYEDYLPKTKQTIILTSLSCLNQWISEFSYAPNTSVCVVKTTKKVNAISPVIENAKEYDVILATPSMFKKLIAKNRHTVWKRFIFDEPTHVRVPGIQMVLANFTWFVSATPGNIDRHSRSWVGHLFDHLYYEGISQLFTVRNPVKFVKTGFKMPATKWKTYVCSQPLASSLRGLVSSEVMERVEAGDISGAISQLGGSTSSHENLIDIIREDKIRLKDYIVFHLNRARDDSRKKQWEDRLKDVDSQLLKLDETVRENLADVCPICMDDMTEPILEPNCGKLFCAECLLRWVAAHNRCPICRQDIETAKLVHISNDSSRKESKMSRDRKPTKLECMKQIFEKRFKENKNAKFILSCQYHNGYDSKIRTYLEEAGINYCEISGRCERRKKIIDSFQNGDTRVIFLKDFVNTAGVNLHAATDIIIYYTMRDEDKTQLVGRANRIGRQTPLTVHVLTN